jgi:hypothetical protein
MQSKDSTTDYGPSLLGDIATKYIDFDISVIFGFFHFQSKHITATKFPQRRC